MNVRIFIFSIVSLAFSACNKAIDMVPENSLTFENAIQTEKDLEAVLNGAGQLAVPLTCDNLGYSALPMRGEFADEYAFGWAWNRIMSQGDPIYGLFGDHYKLIAQSNIVLKFAGDIGLSKERLAIYKGQAYFYKALAYYVLIRNFGDCILIKDDIDLNPVAKSPWPLVADYAIEMAQNAADLLPEFDRVTNSASAAPRYKSTPCKGAAYALLAQLCAWKAGGKYFAEDQNYDARELWKRAEAACNSVISSGTYSLAANPEEVCTSVLSGNSKESVYETIFKDLWYEQSNYLVYPIFIAREYQSYPVIPNSSPYDIGNNSFRIKNTSVRQLYPTGDLRKYAYFYQFEEMSNPANNAITRGFAYPYKWRNVAVQTVGQQAGLFTNYNANKIWWRLADIILLRAECRARLGDNGSAITDLNTIRTRANADPYSATEYGGDIRYAVFKEREKELLLEEHRYFDIIRNGYVRTELEGNFRTATDQDFKDGMFFLCIDAQEFIRNPLMRQNKYWKKFL